MSKKADKNVLLIGNGLIGRVHAENIIKTEGIQLIGVVTKNPKAHSEDKKNYRVPFYGSITQLEKLDDIDGVVIATPNNSHLEYLTWALDNGKKVLVEKPVFANVKDLSQDNYNRFIRNKSKILVGHHRLHGEIIKEANRILNTDFGRIVAISVEVILKKPSQYFEEAEWRKLSGAGPIQINATHEIATLVHLFGKIHKVSVVASNETRGFEVEDTAGICMIFRNGIVATLLVSDNCASVSSWELLSGENPIYPRVFGQDCIKVHGLQNSLYLPSLTKICGGDRYDWHKSVEICNGPKPAFQYVDPMLAEMQNFSAMLNNNCQPLVDIDLGIHVLEVITAIEKSIETKQQIAISSFV